jgi:site-specific DNA-cytosine methylase
MFFIIMPPLRSLDLFSGVGGITRALAGFAEPVAYCEIDKSCQIVMNKLMNKNLLPRAPIFNDVCTLRAKDLPTRHIDMIVGGWPCQDISNFGLGEGLAGERSGLISEVFRLTDELKPKLVFLENVPPVLSNGLDTIIKEFVHKRGYELRWAVIPASTVGAPHLRKRWFGLLVKKGWRYEWDSLSPYIPFEKRWDKERYPRMLLPSTKLERRNAHLRAAMMGNSVVPDAVRAAFLTLVSGFYLNPAMFGVFNLSPPTFKLHNPLVDNVEVFKDITNNKKAELPAWAVVTPNKHIFKLITVPKLRKPKITLTFDSRKFKHAASKVVTAEILRKPVHATAWSTPRKTSNVSYVLTTRTWRDLPTQARFEVNTPNNLRPGIVNPLFVEWLMGYPKDWTKL